MLFVGDDLNCHETVLLQFLRFGRFNAHSVVHIPADALYSSLIHTTDVVKRALYSLVYSVFGFIRCLA